MKKTIPEQFGELVDACSGSGGSGTNHIVVATPKTISEEIKGYKKEIVRLENKQKKLATTINDIDTPIELLKTIIKDLSK